MRQIHVKKGETLQKSGDVNRNGYLVISGLLRSYSIDQKGKEHIFMFAPENWTIADAPNTHNSCDLTIDALEDSVVIIKDKTLKNTTDTKLLFNRIGVLQTRVIMLMSSSAIERYEHFIETYTDIAQRVPQKMIASYLGITPEALSKAKGDKMRRL